MSFPQTPSQQELRRAYKVQFNSEYMQVCPTRIGSMEVFGVLLDESSSVLRANVYKHIWTWINTKQKLRLELTGSINPVSLRQVRDSGGFGLVVTTEPRINGYIKLTYHPRVDGKLKKTGHDLGSCNLGPVRSLPRKAA